MAARFFLLADGGNREAARFQDGCQKCGGKSRSTFCFSEVDLKKGVELPGWKKSEKTKCTSFLDVHNHYENVERDSINHFKKKGLIPAGQEIEPDPALDRILKLGICPKGLISLNSYYWWETIALCDSEFMLTYPNGFNDTNGIFFDALKIIRSEKSKVREEDGKNDSNKRKNRK